MASLFHLEEGVTDALPAQSSPEQRESGLDQQQVLNAKLLTEVANDNCALVRQLLAEGASPDATWRTTFLSAVHVASHHGHLDVLHVLRDHGAILRRFDKLGRSPLHLAVLGGHADCAGSLADDPHLLAARVGQDEGIPRDEWITDGQHQDLQYSDDARDGDQALHVAVVTGAVGIAQTLLEKGAEITALTAQKKTSLHLAVARNQLDVLKMLVNRPDKDRVLSLADNRGKTPLFQAIFQGNVEALKLLLAAGANIKEVDTVDRTVIQCATEVKDKVDILKALFEFDAQTGSGTLSTIKDKLYKFKMFRGTALHVAALRGDIQSTEVLLKYRCNPSLKITESKCFNGFTPLHLAASKGFDKIVKLLLDYNVELVYSTSENGWTPLHVACENRQRKTVQLLLSSGADLSSVCNNDGQESSAADLLMYQVPLSVGLLKDVLNSAIKLKSKRDDIATDYITIDYSLLMPRGDKERQMKVLCALLGTGDHLGQQQLFSHPVIESFLRLQWRTLRIFYYLLLAINLLFVVAFSIMASLLSLGVIERNGSTAWMIVLLVILAVLLVIRDINFQITMGFGSFLLQESWKMISYALCIAVVSWPGCLKEVATVAVILTWSQFTIFFAHDPEYGRHMFMFLESVKSFSKVIVSFTCLITGFMFVFIIEFQGVSPFGFPGAFTKTIVMMTNEFEYNETSKTFLENNKSMIAAVFANIVFIIFVFLVGIVLMNLLVAKAVTETNTVDFMRKLALFVSKYDGVLCGYPFKLLPRKLQDCLTGEKVKSEFKMNITKDYSRHSKLFPAELKRDILETAYQNAEARKNALKMEQKEKKEEEKREEEKRKQHEQRLAENEMMENRIREMVRELSVSIELISRELKLGGDKMNITETGPRDGR